MRCVRIHPNDDDDGFTLIELMVVVLIIGVLVAIAIPTFLGVRTRAQDRALQSELRTGLAAALAFFAETRTWTPFDAAQAESEEPALDWIDDVAPAVGEISITVHTGTNLNMVGHSDSGTYFCLRYRANSPVFERGRGTAFADVDEVAECTGGW